MKYSLSRRLKSSQSLKDSLRSTKMRPIAFELSTRYSLPMLFVSPDFGSVPTHFGATFPLGLFECTTYTLVVPLKNMGVSKQAQTRLGVDQIEPRKWFIIIRVRKNARKVYYKLLTAKNDLSGERVQIREWGPNEAWSSFYRPNMAFGTRRRGLAIGIGLSKGGTPFRIGIES